MPMRLLLLLALLLTPLAAAAYTPPEIHLLRSSDPADWARAVQMVVPDEQYAVPALLVGEFCRRLPDLPPELQLRLLHKMKYALEHDPRAVAVWRQLAAQAATAEVRETAAADLQWLANGASHYPTTSTAAPPPDWLPNLQLLLTLLLLLAPLLLGLALLLWGLRLLQLRRLFLHLPVGRCRTPTPGMTLLRGEVQAEGLPLFRPDSDELCVYYVGAERQQPGLRFWLVDASGRLPVDPAGAVLLSEDGVLTPGEEVAMLASIELEGAGNDRRWLLRKANPPRSLFERLAHFLIDRLFGLASGSGLSKMLFSDPARCFWIWDAADEPPFGRRGEVAQIVAIFLFAAIWLTLTVVAATALWQGKAGLPGFFFSR